MDKNRELIQNLKELNRLESQFLKLSNEEKTPETDEEMIQNFVNMGNISINAFKLKEKISTKIAFIDDPIIDINNKINDLDGTDHKDIEITFKKIKEDKKFYSIDFFCKYYKILISSSIFESNGTKQELPSTLDSSTLNLFEEKDPEYFHDHFLGNSQYRITEYYYNRLRISPLLVSKNIPRRLDDYFSEIRETYSWCLYKACISLSRALLDHCITEELIKKPSYKKEKTEIKKIKGRFDFDIRIDLALKLRIITEKLTEDAHTIRKKANIILHDPKKHVKNNDKETYDLIHKTVGILEWIYRKK